MKKNLPKKLVILLVFILAMSMIGTGCGGSDPAPTDGEKTVIKLTAGAGHPGAAVPYVKAASEFFIPEVSKRVSETTDYEIEWTEAYAGSVAKLAEVMTAVENGLLDVGFVCPAFEPSNLYLHNIDFLIPFITPDAEMSIKVKTQLYSEFDEFYEPFENMNQKMLGIGGNGCYQLISTYPIEGIEDIQNVAIAGTGPNLPLLEGTGAIPIQGDLNEAYTSFETGVYKGWIMFPMSTYSFKLYEVAPYQLTTDFGAVANGLITINLDVWNELPKEVQDIMVAVGEEYGPAAGKMANEGDQNAIELLTAEGMVITQMDPVAKAEYAAAMPNLPMRWVEEAESKGYPGREILKRYIEIMAEEGYDMPRDWLSE